MGHDSAEKAPETDSEQVIDMTEVAAAIAILNGHEPPSGRVTVPASILPFTEKIKKEAAAQKTENHEPGDQMPDGTFYLGRFTSNDGKTRDWFAAAEDAADEGHKKLLLGFNEASKYAKNSQAHEHDDWMVPGMGCLSLIFNYRNKISGLDQGLNQLGLPSGQYWSSDTAFGGGQTKAFSSGMVQNIPALNTKLSVRLVRSVIIQGATP